MAYQQYQQDPMSRQPRPVAPQPSAFAPLYGGMPVPMPKPAPQGGALAQAAAQRVMAPPQQSGGFVPGAQQAVRPPQAQPALPQGMTPEMLRMFILRQQAQGKPPMRPAFGNINSRPPMPRQAPMPMSISGVRG